jgi:hypothetical protein
MWNGEGRGRESGRRSVIQDEVGGGRGGHVRGTSTRLSEKRCRDFCLATEDEVNIPAG